jgi:hypothetical protein
MIVNYASLACAVITFCMAIFQLCLSFGLPFGEYALGGMNKVIPKKLRLNSAAYFLLFFFIACLYLQNGHYINLYFNENYVNIILIVNTVFLACATYFDAVITKSKKEKYAMTPPTVVTLLLSIVALFLKLR